MLNNIYKLFNLKKIYRKLIQSVFIFLVLFIFTIFILKSSGFRCSISEDFYTATFGIYFSLLLLCYLHFINLKYVINAVIYTFNVLIFLNILILCFFTFLDTSLSTLNSVIYAFSDKLIITRVYTFEQLYAGAVLYCKNNNYNIDFEDIKKITLYGKNMEDIKLKLTDFNLALKEVEDGGFWTKSMILGVVCGVISVAAIGGYVAYQFYTGSFADTTLAADIIDEDNIPVGHVPVSAIREQFTRIANRLYMLEVNNGTLVSNNETFLNYILELSDGMGKITGFIHNTEILEPRDAQSNLKVSHVVGKIFYKVSKILFQIEEARRNEQ